MVVLFIFTKLSFICSYFLSRNLNRLRVFYVNLDVLSLVSLVPKIHDFLSYIDFENRIIFIFYLIKCQMTKKNISLSILVFFLKD